MSRHLLLAALITAFLAYSSPAVRAQTPTQTALLTELSLLGLSPKDGLALIREGLARAIPNSTGASAVGQGAYRQAVETAIGQSGRFLETVVSRLRYLRVNNLISPSTASELGHGSTWVGRTAARRAGAVALEPMLAVLGLAAVGTSYYIAGRELRLTIFREWDQTADEAEAAAYSNLLKTLILKTGSKKSNIKLCGGMTLGEAATRLRINLRTSPKQPYWKIICPRKSKPSASKSSGGVAPCPTRRCGGAYSASRPTCLAFDNGNGGCPPPYHSKNRYGCCRGW